MNVVYEIDPEVVCDTVTKKLDDHARWRDYNLETLRHFDRDPSKHAKFVAETQEIYEAKVHTELTHYLFVRVVKTKPKKFILVYGDEDNETVTHGTGPFASLQKACAWFTNQGR